MLTDFLDAVSEELQAELLFLESYKALNRAVYSLSPQCQAKEADKQESRKKFVDKIKDNKKAWGTAFKRAYEAKSEIKFDEINSSDDKAVIQVIEFAKEYCKDWLPQQYRDSVSLPEYPTSAEESFPSDQDANYADPDKIIIATKGLSEPADQQKFLDFLQSKKVSLLVSLGSSDGVKKHNIIEIEDLPEATKHSYFLGSHIQPLLFDYPALEEFEKIYQEYKAIREHNAKEQDKAQHKHIVVRCASGVGRTGTFNFLLLLRDALDKDERLRKLVGKIYTANSPDALSPDDKAYFKQKVKQIINDLRKQRPAVQSSTQFKGALKYLVVFYAMQYDQLLNNEEAKKNAFEKIYLDFKFSKNKKVSLRTSTPLQEKSNPVPAASNQMTQDPSRPNSPGKQKVIEDKKSNDEKPMAVELQKNVLKRIGIELRVEFPWGRDYVALTKLAYSLRNSDSPGNKNTLWQREIKEFTTQIEGKKDPEDLKVPAAVRVWRGKVLEKLNSVDARLPPETRRKQLKEIVENFAGEYLPGSWSPEDPALHVPMPSKNKAPGWDGHYIESDPIHSTQTLIAMSGLTPNKKVVRPGLEEKSEKELEKELEKFLRDQKVKLCIGIGKEGDEQDPGFKNLEKLVESKDNVYFNFQFPDNENLAFGSTDLSRFEQVYQRYLTYQQNTEEKNRIAVHCASGIGRTGTFNLMLMLRESLDKNASFSRLIDKILIHQEQWNTNSSAPLEPEEYAELKKIIRNIFCSLRKQRFAVQTPGQFETALIYTAVLRAQQIGLSAENIEQLKFNLGVRAPVKKPAPEEKPIQQERDIPGISKQIKEFNQSSKNVSISPSVPQHLEQQVRPQDDHRYQQVLTAIQDEINRMKSNFRPAPKVGCFSGIFNKANQPAKNTDLFKTVLEIINGEGNLEGKLQKVQEELKAIIKQHQQNQANSREINFCRAFAYAEKAVVAKEKLVKLYKDFTEANWNVRGINGGVLISYGDPKTTKRVPEHAAKIIRCYEKANRYDTTWQEACIKAERVLAENYRAKNTFVERFKLSAFRSKATQAKYNAAFDTFGSNGFFEIYHKRDLEGAGNFQRFTDTFSDAFLEEFNVDTSRGNLKNEANQILGNVKRVMQQPDAAAGAANDMEHKKMLALSYMIRELYKIAKKVIWKNDLEGNTLYNALIDRVALCAGYKSNSLDNPKQAAIEKRKFLTEFMESEGKVLVEARAKLFETQFIAQQRQAPRMQNK